MVERQTYATDVMRALEALPALHPMKRQTFFPGMTVVQQEGGFLLQSNDQRWVIHVDTKTGRIHVRGKALNNIFGGGDGKGAQSMEFSALRQMAIDMRDARGISTEQAMKRKKGVELARLVDEITNILEHPRELGQKISAMSNDTAQEMRQLLVGYREHNFPSRGKQAAG